MAETLSGQHVLLESSKRNYGLGEDAVSFISVGVLDQFEHHTLYLFGVNEKIKLYYTIEDLTGISKFLRILNKENREANKNDWNHLVNELLNKKDVTVEGELFQYLELNFHKRKFNLVTSKFIIIPLTI